MNMKTGIRSLLKPWDHRELVAACWVSVAMNIFQLCIVLWVYHKLAPLID